jgi:tetratricopeptide (TPR) repeat protein
LVTAGAYLHQSTFAFERYLQEYERHWNFDPQRPLSLQEYRERTLYTTWDLSYIRLQSEDVDAAKLLGLLAYFSNRRLWYELFRAGLSDDSPQWLHGMISSDVEFESTMRKLTSYCFLEVQTSVGSWSMHSCVHDWTFAALNKVVDEKQYWYTFDCVGASVEQEDLGSLGHSHLADLTAHALRLGHVNDHRGEVMDCLIDDRLGRAALIAGLLTQQVQLVAAEQIYIFTLAGYEKALGADHTSTLNTVNNLGLLYRDQGKLDEAEKMCQRALAGYEKALGADHTSTLNTVNNLGLLYRDQGKLDEAEKMCQRALAGREKALGADHISTIDSVHCLALSLLTKAS